MGARKARHRIQRAAVLDWFSNLEYAYTGDFGVTTRQNVRAPRAGS